MSLLIQSFLSDVETPVSLFHKLSGQSPLTFLFESADGDKRIARFSIIGLDPLLSVRLKGGLATIRDYRENLERVEVCTEPFQLLKQLQMELLPETEALPDALSELPLTAGWVGYFGYGLTRYLENIPQPQNDILNVPDAYAAFYDSMIVFDHLYRRMHFVSHRAETEAHMLLAQVEKALETQPKPAVLPIEGFPDTQVFDGVQASVSKAEYMETVEKAQAYIREGQALQIVLAQRFSRPVQSSALDIYRVATAINPSPYAYFLQFPEFSYLGSSPETFLRCRGGKVLLKALAGTRPRGVSPEHDELLAQELRQNTKEMAEHRMLVDLGRNDLGRVCQAGSVQVGDLARVTRYSHVMHLATEITGLLRENLSGYDAIRSCFPRGTVSGAPKIRAMQLLARLETEERGPYSGMVGYIDVHGNTDGAIAIRSALVHNGVAHVHAGAGIVHHSEPEAEYEETRNKARGMLKAIHIAERNENHAYT